MAHDTYKSRIPQMARDLELLSVATSRATAELIAERAKEKVPVGLPDVHLKDAIHVDHVDGTGDFAVVAGDRQTFYGHIVEFGSVRAAAHPFLIPAVEEVRPEIDNIAKRIAKARGMR